VIVIAFVALGAACRTGAPAGGTPARPRPAGDAAWVARARVDLAVFDHDGSGALAVDEIAGLPCALLAALDAELRADVDATFGVTFGVEPGLLWRGHVLGLEPSVRAPLAARLSACLGEPAVPQRDALALRDLMAIAASPTSGMWEVEVRQILRATYDEDRSGEIDRGEVERIPCEIWQALEGAALAGRDRPLLVIYGIADGYLWIGALLGLHVESRTTAAASAIACGLAAD